MKDYTNKFLSIDFEKYPGRNDSFARVSIVDYDGQILLDKYLNQVFESDDVHFADVQKEVADLLDGKILIGYAILNDLAYFGVSHPESMIRDTAYYKGFGKYYKDKKKLVELTKLAKELLFMEMQSSGHDSVENARVNMLLFQDMMEYFTDSKRA